jgi:RNA 2',3'-cyclic 3'-phosphodiesterase
LRLFVAVDVPDGLKEQIEASVVDPLRPALAEAKWTRPEGRHLTLAFLGEVDEGRIGEITDALRSASAKHAPFEAAFDRIGGFPNDRRPRVLWVGIGTGADEMIAIQRDVADALEPLGFAPDDRPFHPHLTLARFPRPKTIGTLPATAVPTTSFRVEEIVLFRSQLHPKGARYSVVEAIPLAR